MKEKKQWFHFTKEIKELGSLQLRAIPGAPWPGPGWDCCMSVSAGPEAARPPSCRCSVRLPAPRARWCHCHSVHAAVWEKTPEDPSDWTQSTPVRPKGNQHWIFTGRTDAESEAPTLWPPDVKSRLNGKRLWRWERLKAGGEGGDRGWDGWMASATQWTCVWASSGR